MLVKKCIRTLKKNTKKNVRVTFVVTYNTTKLSFYTNTKDRIDKLAHSCIVYKFYCPGCSKSYIGITKRTFFERINEHLFKDNNSLVYNHINNCDGVKLGQIQTERDKFNKKIYCVTTVKENISTTDRARRWDILLFKEALHVKEKNSTFNNSLKASKELKIF